METKIKNSEWTGWAGILGYYDIRDCADVMGVSHKVARDFVKNYDLVKDHVKGQPYRLNKDEWSKFCVIAAERVLISKRL